jgi:ribonuclease HII
MPRLKNFLNKGLLEAGCDEAGRGCLAGPVFAAAVILKPGFRHPLLDDSKKLSEKDRNTLRSAIEKKALAWAVGVVSAKEIDEINILNASFLAMHRAVEQLNTTPQFLLIDGNRFKEYPAIPHSCEIKGDGRFKSIAAASILAKTHRDQYMLELSSHFPQYEWHQNKAYPTKIHREAIRKFGPCEHHRKSFTLLPPQLKLKLD